MIQRHTTHSVLILLVYCLFTAQFYRSNSHWSLVLHGVEATGRIVGGTTVTNTTLYPFYAFPAGRFLCGASLIWGNVLVTAAHCGPTVWNDGIRLGATVRNSSGTPFYNVSKVVNHPKFRAATFANDVSLIFLNTFVENVTYATMNKVGSIPAVGSNMTAIGFGRLSESGPSSQTLQQVDLIRESFRVCSRQYWNLNDQQQICNRGLAAGGKDTCNGDSGGPLFVQGTTNIVALVSYGVGCARAGTPAVNVRLSAYVSWIEVTICSQVTSFPLPSYCTPKTRK